MRITKEQEDILHSMRCVRVRESNPSLLNAIKGAVTTGGKQSDLVEHFRHQRHLDDDRNGALASYLVLSPNDLVLLFFSIRCGELFEMADSRKMILGHNAMVGLYALRLHASGKANLKPEEEAKARDAINEALQEGLSFDDFVYYYEKKKSYIEDTRREQGKEISRVSKVYSGVELKFYGLNDDARSYWKSLGLPRRMGESLFWQIIVPKLEEMQQIVGCQYMYLFAADQEPEGHLVTYYRTVLHVDAMPVLSSNKPYFDYESMFLYQEISELVKQRQYFFEHFNVDADDDLNV